MTTDSTHAGYLAPTSAPLTEEQLEDVLTAMVAGITGLPGKMVRPRWQPKPPKQPEHTVDWCAVGVPDEDDDSWPAVTHSGDGDGADTVVTWETLNVLASFYGPNSGDLAKRLRAGLMVEQNRAPLRQAGLALGGIGRRVRLAELVNGYWVKRVDLPIELRNEARRVYAVRNIKCGSVTIETDTGLIVQTTPMT
jgi:hypothetical protein